MGHTPDPWQIIPPSDHTENWMIAQVPPANNTAPFYIGAVYTYEPKHKEVDAEANANLMGNALLMFQVLEAVEWIDGMRGHDICPRCLHIQSDGHADDCKLAAALAAARGER